jgi:hypothetical protein
MSSDAKSRANRRFAACAPELSQDGHHLPEALLNKPLTPLPEKTAG